MTQIVVDASVAVKWQVVEPLNAEARELLTSDALLVAPDWLLIEAASTYWKKVRNSELLIDHAERHLADLPEFFAELFPARDLVGKATELAFALRHPVYDCLYLALAERKDCQIVTADKKFHEVLEAAGLSDRAILLG